MLSIEINLQQRIFKVVASGLVTKEDGAQLSLDLIEESRKINTAEYHLLLDVTGFRPANQDALDEMAKVNEFYVKTSFIDRICIASKSFVANSQINRVTNAKEDMQFVETYEEAKKLMGKI